MKNFYSHSVLALLTSLITCSIPILADAKTINFYQEPKTESKIIGNIDTNAGIVTIFTTPDGQWIKVGDPRNGNAGWIKSADLGDKNFSFNVIKTNDGNNQYQVIQYGNTKPLSATEINNKMKEMEEHEVMLQKDMQNMMKDMFSPWLHTPMFVPVVLVPVDAKDPSRKAITNKQNTETKNPR